MKLSIVTTLYRSAATVSEFCQRATAAARAYAGESYEIVLVNDGSPDKSHALALAIAERDSHFCVIDLSRNFGHHKAMMAGLAHAQGEEIFLIDSDLEEDPAWLASFGAQLHAKACDVVYGVQESRRGGLLEKLSGAAFYWLFARLSGVALPNNLVTARLMSRRYLNALLTHGEREVFIAGLWALTGFEQCPCGVNKPRRALSTYSFRHKAAVLINGVTAFSSAPLTAIFYLGLTISVLSGLYIVYLVLHWWLFASPPDGWTSVMASIWLLGGLIICFVGVVGIYLSKIFAEVKQRPRTIVRDIYRQHDASSE